MGRPRRVGKVHPESNVVIYNDGTCDAGTGESRRGYISYYVKIFDKKGRFKGSRSFSLHRHVAELFVPNPLNKPIVNHKDGKKYNAKASNLEWVTHRENCLHAHKKGLNKKKLTEDDVRNIRKSKMPSYRICYKYDVSARYIWMIRNYMAWKNVK